MTILKIIKKHSLCNYFNFQLVMSVIRAAVHGQIVKLFRLDYRIDYTGGVSKSGRWNVGLN